MSDDAEPLSGLLGAVARADRLAFAELYRLCSARLYGIARRMLADEADARDVLQESFLRIWQRAADFDPQRGEAMGWMVGILRHACLDRLRTRGRAQGREDPLDLAAEVAISDDIAARSHILRCMKGLAGAELRVIMLAVQQGYSHTEVAGQLDLPLGTVKSHARRGLAKLRFCLEGAQMHG